MKYLVLLIVLLFPISTHSLTDQEYFLYNQSDYYRQMSVKHMMEAFNYSQLALRECSDEMIKSEIEAIFISDGTPKEREQKISDLITSVNIPKLPLFYLHLARCNLVMADFHLGL